MGIHFDRSDLTTYGAADEEELVQILSAIDRANGIVAPKRPDGPEWTELFGAALWDVGSLDNDELPDAPGVYLWHRGGEPIYLGTTKSLGRRILREHLGTSANLANSSLRRNIYEFLYGVPASTMANPNPQKALQHQIIGVHQWLMACELRWVERATAEEALALRNRLRDEYRPLLNRV